LKPKLVPIIFKNPVRTSKRTPHFTITKDQLVNTVWGNPYLHWEQCSKWVGICRCTTPDLNFVSGFHTGTYQCVLYQFIFLHFFLTVYPCFAFKKYTSI
jgi:hypothetical protein